MQIRQFCEKDISAVIRLWRDCGLVVPWNDPGKDISRKLAAGADLFLVGEMDCEIIGSVMGGYDGHRGWVNYLAVHPDHRSRNFGRNLMEAVENKLEELGCPKLNLQVRTSNEQVRAFYEAIGYKQDDVVSFGKRLIPDE